MAASSSALVGSLIGVRTGVGEEVDCLPHIVVAFLTDAKADCREVSSSFAGEISTFGNAVSFETEGLGLSGLVGNIGSGRENRDCPIIGEGVGDAWFGVSTDFGSGDFCGVTCDADILLSLSKDVGFFGTLGEAGLGELIDSGRGD